MNTFIFGWLYFFGIMATAGVISSETKKYPWGVFFTALLWPITVPLCTVAAACSILFVGRK
jgi:hypothetical protein